jgi:hypothetical protein
MAPRSSALRLTRRSRTRTQNDGSERYAASSWTAPSSGTARTSSCSYASTSSTTTPTDPTAASDNAHPTIAKSLSIGPANRSDDTPPATDSSTSTAKQPEPSPQRPANRERINFGAPNPGQRPTTSTKHRSPHARTHFRHPQASRACAIRPNRPSLPHCVLRPSVRRRPLATSAACDFRRARDRRVGQGSTERDTARGHCGSPDYAARKPLLTRPRRVFRHHRSVRGFGS